MGGLISSDLNYLDAQAKPSNRLPPDRYSPLLQFERRDVLRLVLGSFLTTKITNAV